MHNSDSSVNAVTLPSSDLVLAERVREKMRGLGLVEPKVAVDALRRDLSVVYPRVDVHLQHALAGFGAPTVYVLRDGTARDELASEEWAGNPECARVVTDASGKYVAANEAAAELFGVSRDEIVGREAGRFTRPDTRIEDAAELWRLLERTGRLHSLAVVTRPDGTELRVEFITIRDQTRNGYVTSLRPVG